MSRLTVMCGLFLLVYCAEGAEEKRGEEFLRECTIEDSASRIACLSYLLGYLDGVVIQAAAAKRNLSFVLRLKESRLTKCAVWSSNGLKTAQDICMNHLGLSFQLLLLMPFAVKSKC